MALIKTAAELGVMREGGKLLREIRERLMEEVKPGVEPLQVDALAEDLINKSGGTPSFRTVNGYKWATCIGVNDVVVHGIPTHEPFREGDVVGVDVGLLYKGFHTDTSWTKLVRSSQIADRSEVEKFLKTGEEALQKAISQAKQGNRIGHISQTIQTIVEGAGYSVVRSLVGHGVGRELHESPQVPGILTRPVGRTPLLVPGMVIAIEVIYNMGKPEIIHKNDDGWTLSTADGSLSGLFEQTVEISKNGPIILT